MEFTIKDGTGAGYNVKVDREGRAHTDTVQRSFLELAVLEGNGFNLNTGAISLTDATESAVLFIKSDNDAPLVIKEIIVIAGASTGGTGDATIRIYKNPIDGTIVSNAVDLPTISNRNFSSAKVLDGQYYKGAQGATTTAGSVFSDTTRSSFVAPVNFDAADIVLEKGNSLAVTFQPQTGNTSQSIKVAVTCFLDEGYLEDQR